MKCPNCNRKLYKGADRELHDGIKLVNVIYCKRCNYHKGRRVVPTLGGVRNG